MENGPSSTASETTGEPAVLQKENTSLDVYSPKLRQQFSQALACEKTGDTKGKDAILKALPPADAARYEDYKTLMEQLRLDAIKTVSNPHSNDTVSASATAPAAPSVLPAFESKRTVTVSEKSTNSDADSKVKSSSCCTLS